MSLTTFLDEIILFPNVQKDEMKLSNVPCSVLWDRRRKHFHPQRERVSGQLPWFRVCYCDQMPDKKQFRKEKICLGSQFHVVRNCWELKEAGLEGVAPIHSQEQRENKCPLLLRAHSTLCLAQSPV